MYCVKCGVELQRGIQACPLCGVRTYHPDYLEEKEDGPYPAYHAPEKQNARTLLLMISFFSLLPLFLCPMIDLIIQGHIVWSGFAVGGILIFYLLFVFPFWFSCQNLIIFFPVDMTGILLFLLYISLKTDGGWFLSFAFPATGLLAVIIETMIILIRLVAYEKKNLVTVVIGGGMIALGLSFILLEFLIHITFGFQMLWWSCIPSSAFVLIGGFLLHIGLSSKIRDALYKRFFI